MARPGIWICLCVLAASAASAQMRQVDTSCTIMLLFQSRLSMRHVAASAPWYRCAHACARTLGLHSTARTWRCEICCVAHRRPTRSMGLQIGRLHVAYSALSHQSVRHVVSMTSQHMQSTKVATRWNPHSRQALCAGLASFDSAPMTCLTAAQHV